MMVSVLVVDDEIIVRERLEAKLKKAGFEVTTADDGQGALDEAGKDTHDVAVVDCQMPYGGRDLYVELKERFSDLLLIAMTDLASKSRIETELVPPADAAWAKDSSDAGIGELVTLIHTLLKEKGGVVPE